jgi:hypothetical protein
MLMVGIALQMIKLGLFSKLVFFCFVLAFQLYLLNLWITILGYRPLELSKNSMGMNLTAIFGLRTSLLDTCSISIGNLANSTSEEILSLTIET